MGECMNYVDVKAVTMFAFNMQLYGIGEECDCQYSWYDIHCPSYTAVLLFFWKNFTKKKDIPKKESATKYDGQCIL